MRTWLTLSLPLLFLSAVFSVAVDQFDDEVISDNHESAPEVRIVPQKVLFHNQLDQH